jgi:dienelactone hydrolase
MIGPSVSLCFGRACAASAFLAVSALLLGSKGAPAQSAVRLEMHPVQTVTLTHQEFLTGNLNGKPVVLAGELRIPTPGTDRLPAVVLVHGSGGINASHDRWAQDLNAIGIAAFILDSFTGRGITSTVNNQSLLDSVAMMVDAYRALTVLAKHPRIDPARIAIMGFSKGAVASVYSSTQRFRKLYGPADVEFAAHIGLYTPCNVAYRDDEKATGKPIRLFHGIADDWVSIAPCRTYVDRLKQASVDAVLTEYPDAYHGYDNFTLARPIKVPQAQTTRNCLMQEGDNGQILNANTGQPYNLNDACVERGAQVAYNPAAHQATVKAVKTFLATTFALKE